MKKKTVITKIISTVVLALFAVACADGGHITPKGSFGANLTQPAISSFAISKVGTGEAGGKSVVIDEGDSVALSWEVIMAAPEVNAEAGEKSIQIKEVAADESGEDALNITLTSDALGIKMENMKPVDSIVIDKVASDAVFVLTATFGEASVKRQVSATVNPIIPLDITFTATPEVIVEGDYSELCWETSRTDAVISIINSDGETIHGAAAYVEDAEEDVEPLIEAEETPEEEVAEEVPEEDADLSAKAAVAADEVAPIEDEVGETEDLTPVEPASSDCVAVYPTKTTKYTLTASAKGVDNVQKEITVEVEEKLKVEIFEVSKDMISGETEIRVSWKVVPEEAEVVIDKVSDEVQPSEGDASVSISETTIFTLTATFGGQTIEESKTVEYKNLAISIRPVVGGRQMEEDKTTVEGGTFFEGEEVTVGWDATVEGAPSSDIQISVSGSEQTYGAKDEVRVPVSSDGEISITATGEGLDTTTTKVKVNVRKWIGTGAESTSPVSAVVAVPDVIDTLVTGHRSDVDGKGFLYANIMKASEGALSVTPSPIKYFSMLKSAAELPGLRDRDYLDKLHTYPITSLAIGNEGRIYGGVPGGVVYSDDGGMSWDSWGLNGYVYNVTGNYAGQHRACNGFTMDGWKGEKLASLVQVCDIEIDDDGRFFIATTGYTAYLPNGVNAYLSSDDPVNAWYGLGGGPGEEGNVLYGTVNHDLEIVKYNGTKRLYSATDKGLYVSNDRGINWASANLSEPVISIKADVASKKLYAGTESGLYVSSLDGAESWTAVPAISGTIYDIKVDPAQIGTVYLATNSGVQVTRNSGAEWVNVTGNLGAGVVEQIDIAKVGDTVGIYLATDKGTFSSIAKVNVTAPIVTEDPILPAEEETTIGDEDEVTPEPGPTVTDATEANELMM